MSKVIQKSTFSKVKSKSLIRLLRIFVGRFCPSYLVKQKLSCLPGLGKVGGVVDDETESCNSPGLANVGLKTTTRNIKKQSRDPTLIKCVNCECF